MTVGIKMKAELLLSLILLAAPAAARPRAGHSLPAPDELVLKALAGPATGYSGLERVQMFRPGAKPRAVTVRVAALPGGRLRRETKQGRRKTPGLVCVRDGRSTSLYWPARKRLWRGPQSIETPEAGLARLRALYELSVSTGGRVAKQATWRVNLSVPGGRVRLSMWVARLSGLLLKRETYRPDGTLSRRERFTKLQIPADPVESLFRLEVPEGTSVLPWSSPQTEERVAFLPPRLPLWVPDGYMLVSVQSRSPQAKSVLVRYSDGASDVSIEEVSADQQPKLPGKNSRTVKLGTREFMLSETEQGYGLLARTADRVHLFSGDLAEDALVRMAWSLEDGR